ncbi:primosomal protein N' [Spongiibacter sp. KMU-158]|uniref:Replication restart protein PriA n=1 Tax=Spongiibacter pelagi TaxID=2760804 RepID=A0A927GV53_9GAMM|nr:primosomal protein N' [Spongiibacter pelagi]MBD2857703.1 primosomal protein N' [Spongiibacter pelagi]
MFQAVSKPAIIEVAVPCPLRRSFDYLLTGKETHAPQPGQRVLVPFGNRRLVAVIIALKTQSEHQKLKPIIELLDAETPSLSAQQLALGQWAAQYYHHPIGDCLQQMLPVNLRKPGPAEARPSPDDCWQLCADWQSKEAPANRAKQQLALLDAFVQAPQHRLNREQLTELGFKRPLLNELIKRDLVEAVASVGITNTAETPPTLNAEQSHVVDAVTAKLGQFSRFLLEGITGSGKTEVYLRLIHAALQQGKQALVLVPEIGLTPQTLERFERRFPAQVASLHSGMSDNERLKNWLAVRQGDTPILLGTRSAILADLPKLGLIIVDEEHDPSYKQQDGWRYSARDIAVKRAADNHCPVVLGSATPSLDSLFNVERGRYALLQLRQRAGDAKPPAIQLLDIRRQNLHEGLSTPLLENIGQTVAKGQQALIFLNRRGFAPTLQCHGCGWIAQCGNCDARLTVHYRRQTLKCHHCDATAAMPYQCPDCGDDHWLFEGPGTERLEMLLQQQFPNTPVYRIDRDTMNRQGDVENRVEEIRRGGAGIIIGTQMLAKGHHFPNVTLVGIVDMDAGLFSADFRVVERSAQLLVQVAGRAGRAELAGRVLIQTHCPEHPALQTLLKQDYRRFAQQQLAERQRLQQPPASYCAVLRSDAVRLQRAEEFLQQLASALRPHAKGIQMMGPLPAPMTRRAGRFRCSLILQTPNRAKLHQLLSLATQAGDRIKKSSDLRWSIDVDPIELF